MINSLNKSKKLKFFLLRSCEFAIADAMYALYGLNAEEIPIVEGVSLLPCICIGKLKTEKLCIFFTKTFTVTLYDTLTVYNDTCSSRFTAVRTALSWVRGQASHGSVDSPVTSV